MTQPRTEGESGSRLIIASGGCSSRAATLMCMVLPEEPVAEGISSTFWASPDCIFH